MVLGHDRQAPFAVLVRRPVRDRPRLQDAVDFETEVVVQSPRGVLLDDEREQPVAGLPLTGRGLSGARKVALGAVFVERRGDV
jgi:hypothetical protein